MFGAGPAVACEAVAELEDEKQRPHSEGRDYSVRILAQKRAQATPVLSKEQILEAYEAPICQTSMDSRRRFARGRERTQQPMLSR